MTGPDWPDEPKALRRHHGYLPIEDHGLIGDGTTAALVGRDGTVSWLCAPRFDGPAVFCGLLDRDRGGAFALAPDDLVASRQRYAEDSGVLITELHGREGIVELTDLLPLRPGADLAEPFEAGRNELVRRARVVHGRARLRMDVALRAGGAAIPRAGGLQLRSPGLPETSLHLRANRQLDGPRGTYELSAGEELHLVLNWSGHTNRSRRPDVEAIIAATLSAWRRWLACFSYSGPQEPLVRRSAVTLKLLDYFANGAILAAPTSSLPEAIGGPRNWDYRYAWVRDAAFSVYALRRIGLRSEGDAFLGWVLDSLEAGGGARVLYDIDGAQPPPERIDEALAGYRASSPVRWGNAAAEQRQHDVYGEIVDCAYQWMRGGGQVEPPLWDRLRALIDAAAGRWDVPDHGIWEVRTPGRVFTYSAALCQVAVDRGARMAAGLGLPATDAWSQTAARITRAVVDGAWNPELQSFTEHIDGTGGLDASLLTLPLRRVVAGSHPRMVATTAAIQRRLGAGDGLLYRYLPAESPDGLPGEEGAFVLCSFWLVDNLAAQGRLEEATELYDSLCGRANALGLLPEQIDPSTGEFLGNYPQAFSHVGVISSGVNLARRLHGPDEPREEA